MNLFYQDRFSAFSIFVLLVAASGGFLFGYHTAIVSGVLAPLKDAYHLSVFDEGFLVSILLLGGLVGALFAGALADRWGRKKLLIVTAIIFCIGALNIAAAGSYSVILLGRVICGLAVGLSSVVSPMYLAEIAPPHYRGRFVALFQLMLAVGILIAYGVNILFVKDYGWRIVFFISFIPSALQFIALFFLPETPAWLLRHGKDLKAINALEHLREDTEWKEQLPDIQQKAHSNQKGKLAQLMANPRLRYVVLVGFLLSVFQQITGINTVIYYAPKIFSMSGLDSANGALLSTLAVGIINCIATAISVWLLDKVGRRILLLIGVFGMTLGLFILSFVFILKTEWAGILALFSILGYVSCFAIGLGPITWVVLSEIFPLKIRAKALSFALFANWLSNYIVSLTFLILLDRLGAIGTFFIYGVISAIAFVFIYFCIPETKGKSLEEIESMVAQGKF